MIELTPIQIRALEVLRDNEPLHSSGAGYAIWPDKEFKNSQGAALAGGGLMGKLRKLELVKVEYYSLSGQTYPKGWVLTAKGRQALEQAS